MKGHSIHEIDGPVYAVQIREPQEKRPLFISFGTLTEDVSFSFSKETDEYTDVHRILVRDASKLFYQTGLPPITSSIPETISYLNKLINEMEPSKVVVFGESVGAYAAILFGANIGADEVHAFSPITFLENRNRIVWKEAYDEMMANCKSDFFDLKKSLDQIDYQTKINIYYDHSFEYYTFHVENIQACSGVSVNKFPFGRHNLVNKLKVSGEFQNIIKRALSTYIS